MQPVLALLPLSDAFADVWARIAAAVGAHAIAIDSVAELPALRDACALLLTAGGEEEAALQLLEELLDPIPLPVAVVGTSTDYRLVASLCRAGANDYFAMPKDLGLLHSWLGERVETVTDYENALSQSTRLHNAHFASITGNSPQLLKTLGLARKLIPHGNTTILITGETGTGKDLLANAIHLSSSRATMPFIELNCTAFPPNLLEAELFGFEKGAFTDAKVAKPGLFEVANGGTIFLDEIGDLSSDLQPKLLRVIETNRVRRLGSVKDIEVDFRIIAATHRNLETLVQTQSFRQDLFYRLNVIRLTLPPLRDRGGDILELADRFTREISAKFGLPLPNTNRAWEDALLRHSWPGNIRELKNAIERAVLLGDGVLLPKHIFTGRSPLSGEDHQSQTLQSVIEHTVLHTLRKLDGNKKRTAEALGISRKYLYSILATAVEAANDQE